MVWNIHKHQIPNGCSSSYYLEPYKRKYICPSHEDCIIDCEKFMCNNSVIDASNANYLDLECGININCSYMDIYLVSTPSHIFYNDVSKNVTIYADNGADVDISRNSYTAWSERIVNDTMATITIFRSCLNIFILISVITYKIWGHCKQIIKQEFISSKPSPDTLYLCAFIDLAIFMTMYWFFIKFCILFDLFDNHCDDNYPGSAYKEACNIDDICDFHCHDGDPNDCHCSTEDEATMWFFIITCFGFGIGFLSEIMRFAIVATEEGNISSAECHYLPFVKKYTKQRRYLQREFWVAKDTKTGKRDWLWYIGTDCLLRYVLIILAAAYYGYYHEDIAGDLAVTWYEFWSCLILLIMKIGMNMDYTFGEEYEERSESEEYERWNRYDAFRALCKELNNVESLGRIIYEYNDEYEDYMKLREVILKDLFVCDCCNKQYESLPTHEI